MKVTAAQEAKRIIHILRSRFRLAEYGAGVSSRSRTLRRSESRSPVTRPRTECCTVATPLARARGACDRSAFARPAFARPALAGHPMRVRNAGHLVTRVTNGSHLPHRYQMFLHFVHHHGIHSEHDLHSRFAVRDRRDRNTPGYPPDEKEGHVPICANFSSIRCRLPDFPSLAAGVETSNGSNGRSGFVGGSSRRELSRDTGLTP